MKRATHISASPNTEKDDVLLAFKLLFSPWNWRKKSKLENFNKEVKEIYPDVQGVLNFDSARTALYVLFESLGVGPGDEVLVPAFSCHVIANSVIWHGARAILVDADLHTYNFDLIDLKRKISPRTKAVIVQHTFGIRQNVEQIREICGKNVIVVEDLAHTFAYPDQAGQCKVEGDYAVATFGIEKGFSGVRGGIAMFKDQNDVYVNTSSFKLKRFPALKTFVSLMNPIFWFFTNKIYYFGVGRLVIGKLLTRVARQIGLLGNIIEKPEYICDMPSWMPAEMSSALSELALHQLKKRERTNKHRAKLTTHYSEKFGKVSNDKILFRYPMRVVQNRAAFIKKYKDQGILLGDWYRSVLHVPDSTLELIGYQKGDCKNAELLSKEVVNFPTSINVNWEEIERIK